LISGEEHRRVLDAFGRLEPDAEAVAAAHRQLRQLEEEACRLREALAAAERESDYLPRLAWKSSRRSPRRPARKPRWRSAGNS
jgi:DNA repair ATPase RecN